jgi:hypothetical protein
VLIVSPEAKRSANVVSVTTGAAVLTEGPKTSLLEKLDCSEVVVASVPVAVTTAAMYL